MMPTQNCSTAFETFTVDVGRGEIIIKKIKKSGFYSAHSPSSLRGRREQLMQKPSVRMDSRNDKVFLSLTRRGSRINDAAPFLAAAASLPPPRRSDPHRADCKSISKGD